MSGKIMNNLGSLPVVFTSGNGSTLTDVDGKNYIDFVSGIGVNCLGHGHPALIKAIQDQVGRQIHISNYYNSDIGLAFADAVLQRTGMDRLFFSNSGAEANEAAIKIARKYGWATDRANGRPEGSRHIIVTLEKSFHGRTLTTLAATGQDKFHSPCFAPYTPGFIHIKANDYEALKTAFDDTVCAFMFECVQGEGGVNLVDRNWAQAACVAARKAGAIVIADEVQTGIGRTGTFLASEYLDTLPDVVTLAKGIAGGVPMGACLARGDAAQIFVAGDHQSTFGGNPLACASGLAVLSEVGRPDFLAEVCKKGEYIRTTVAGWKLPCITDIRGKGLMIGLDITGRTSGSATAADIQLACLQAGGIGQAPHAARNLHTAHNPHTAHTAHNPPSAQNPPSAHTAHNPPSAQNTGVGLCISTAGAQTVRFLPPLTISWSEIDTGLSVLYSVLTATSDTSH